MSNRTELSNEELDFVNGGDITYTWNGTSGTIGLDGNNPFILVDKDAYLEYFNKVHGTMTDGDILRYLLAHGIAKVPSK